MILERADIPESEGPEKVDRALADFSLEEVGDSAAFDEAYRALEAVFGPRGELERREVLSAWLEGRFSRPDGSMVIRYHLLVARDRDGRLAGVRDTLMTLDREARRCVALLSHALVLPAFRRTGLAALLRAAPVALARRALAEAGLLGEGAEILAAAEMEAVDPDDRDSVVRLFAYARAGFWAIPPAVLPYAQPDFRDVAALGVEPVPVPLVPVLRQVGEEARPDAPRARVEAFLRHFQSVHALECHPGDVAAIREHARAGLSACPDDPVPLVRLPRDTSEIAALAPLLRGAVLPLYPPRWRGPRPLDEPARELERLVAAWSSSGEKR
jgi:GNAT superfamily N-acetyltransferase